MFLKNCASTIVPFQSIIELDNQLAHDDPKELVPSNFCKYCIKIASDLNLSFCRTNYISMISAMFDKMKQTTSTKLFKSSLALSRSGQTRESSCWLSTWRGTKFW